jgi:hypothetical protein
MNKKQAPKFTKAERPIVYVEQVDQDHGGTIWKVFNSSIKGTRTELSRAYGQDGGLERFVHNLEHNVVNPVRVVII